MSAPQVPYVDITQLCRETGVHDPAPWREICSICDGVGWREDENGENVECDVCKGSGEVDL